MKNRNSYFPWNYELCTTDNHAFLIPRTWQKTCVGIFSTKFELSLGYFVIFWCTTSWPVRSRSAVFIAPTPPSALPLLSDARGKLCSCLKATSNPTFSLPRVLSRAQCKQLVDLLSTLHHAARAARMQYRRSRRVSIDESRWSGVRIWRSKVRPPD